MALTIVVQSKSGETFQVADVASKNAWDELLQNGANKVTLHGVDSGTAKEIRVSTLLRNYTVKTVEEVKKERMGKMMEQMEKTELQWSQAFMECESREDFAAVVAELEEKYGKVDEELVAQVAEMDIDVAMKARANANLCVYENVNRFKATKEAIRQTAERLSDPEDLLAVKEMQLLQGMLERAAYKIRWHSLKHALAADRVEELRREGKAPTPVVKPEEASEAEPDAEE